MLGYDRRQIYEHRLYENQGLPALIDLVEGQPRRFLDIGCGDGANMRLLAARGHSVVGVTLSTSEARVCRSQGFSCVVCDIVCGLPFAPMSFDALLFSHVLEHFPFPETVLHQSLSLLVPGGQIYVALPNALQIHARLRLLMGQFRYTETGIMDRTHLRFYDFGSAHRLLEGAGVHVTHHLGVGQVPLGPVRRFLPALASRIDTLASGHRPGLFAFHILLVGTRG